MITPETETPIPVLEVPVAEMLTVIRQITTILRHSTATTHHQLEQIIQPFRSDPNLRHVHSGCEILFRHISKEFGRITAADPQIAHPMHVLAKHCATLERRWSEGPARIQNYLQPFLQRAKRVMLHGFSTVLCDALVQAHVVQNVQIYITEGAPLFTGERAAAYICERWEALHGNDAISSAICIIPDSAAAAILPSVGFVLVGASAVTINGGAVGMVGCNQLAVLAHALGKDFYVAAEVFRFSRTFPLSTGDLRAIRNDLEPGDSEGGETEMLYPLLEYVPPSNISMFFTNLGLFPPATAADELYSIFMGECAGGKGLLE